MAKRIISAIILVLMLALSLTSCAQLDSYKKNLGDEYEIEMLTSKEIDELLHNLSVEADDYIIVDIMLATNDLGQLAYFIECESSDEAKKLTRDTEDAVEEGKNKYDCGEFKAELDGKFVLIGDAAIIDKAMGK